MNSALIKYYVFKIAKQILTQALLLINFCILMLIFLTQMIYYKGRLIEFKIFSFITEEPYLIKQVLETFFTLIVLINILLMILIVNRFYHEIKYDSLIEIILSKLKHKNILVFSTFMGIFGFFFTLFFIMVFSVFLIFWFKYHILFFPNIFISLFDISSAILLIASFSFFLNQFLDGFTSSIIIILLFLFGNLILALTLNNDILFYLFNFLLPLNFVSKNLIQSFNGILIYDPKYLLLPIQIISLFYFGSVLFLRKWK